MSVWRRVRIVAFGVLALVPIASPGSAQDIRMRWNNCLGVGIASTNRNYACDGSGTSARVVCSFTAPAGITAFLAMQAVVSIQTIEGTLPDWWRLGIGECRDGSFVFPASLTGVGNTTTCLNPWRGAAWVGNSWEYHSGVIDPSQGQIVMVQHRDAPVPLIAGAQYIAGAFELRFDKDLDVGQGSCAGCYDPACLILRRVTLYQASGASPATLPLEANGTYGYVTWQGGMIGCPPLDSPFPWPGPYPVPAKHRSWGAIKSLYR
jgi:hypothetical protein